MATAQIDVNIDDEGRVYPVGSDTPIPADAIDYLTHDRSTLVEGDIVVQADGRAYRISVDPEPQYVGYDTLLAQCVSNPRRFDSIAHLVDPLIRIYHCGEPRHDWIS